MSATVTFTPNESGIEEVAQSEEVLSALRDAAEAIGEAARSYAPNNQKRGIEVLGEEQGTVYVGTANPFAHLFEWGSARTMPYGFMRAGATSVVSRFEES